MNLIDKYMIREWSKVFFLALLATLGILVLERMYDELHGLLNDGATFGQIMGYYLAMIPGFLPVVLPLALFVSLLFTLGNLHKNNEIVAMRAAGMTLFRVTRMLWLAGLFLAAGLWYLNAHLVPWSVEQTRGFKERLSFARQAEERSSDKVGVITSLAFDNKKGGRLWFINRFSEYTYQGFGVNVYSRDDEGRELSRVMAREGYFDDVDGYWYLLKGREITFDIESGEPMRSVPFEVRGFPEFKEDPKLMRALSKNPRDLSMNQLEAMLDAVDDEGSFQVATYAVRYHRILASPVSCLLVVLLAVPFAVGGVRVNPMVAVSKAAGLLFGYYLLVNVMSLMGGQQVLSPWMAVWLPNFALLLVAGWLYRRVS